MSRNTLGTQGRRFGLARFRFSENPNPIPCLLIAPLGCHYWQAKVDKSIKLVLFVKVAGLTNDLSLTLIVILSE
jgi:hypothetical protein